MKNILIFYLKLDIKINFGCTVGLNVRGKIYDLQKKTEGNIFMTLK